MSAERRRRARAALAVLVVGVAGCTAGAPCEPGEETALDYADTSSWICHPGAASDVCRDPLPTVAVGPDGSVTDVPRVVADTTGVACFHVHPTTDVAAAHEVNADPVSVANSAKSVRNQVARLTDVCTVWAPYYRQATVGNYLVTDDDQLDQGCFDTAFGDVARAFDAFLDAVDPADAIVVIGHSQGGQHIARLLRERFDDDGALRGRLLAAFPIGWPVGVQEGSLTGGTSQTVPICSSDDELGCIIALRSFHDGNDLPTESSVFREGDHTVCTHPASPTAQDPLPLASVQLGTQTVGLVRFPEAVDTDQADFVIYEDYFSAVCDVGGDGVRALRVIPTPAADDERDNPLLHDGALLGGNSGMHLLDMHLIQGDLRARIQQLAALQQAGG